MKHWRMFTATSRAGIWLYRVVRLTTKAKPIWTQERKERMERNRRRKGNVQCTKAKEKDSKANECSKENDKERVKDTKGKEKECED